MKIHIFNNTFYLHHSGALYWCEQKMLCVADVHLGKIMHFRKAGIAVPAEASQHNYKHLTTVIDYYKPAVVCFLGDLFHSELNIEWDFFCQWINNNKLKVTLVAGNHDILPINEYMYSKIEYVKFLQIGNFLFTHHPEMKSDVFNFCGHLHPGVRLQGLGKQSVKIPCFVKKPTQLILPAFGTFTGMYEVGLEKPDKIYALGEKEVVEVLIKSKGCP